MIAEALLFTACLGAAADELDSIAVWLDGTPTKARLGDVAFVRVTMRNDGKSPVSLPTHFRPDYGTLLWELVDPGLRLRFWFADDGGCGMAPSVPLLPGQSRVVAYELLPLPNLEHLRTRFWNPDTWEDGRYTLLAYLQMGTKVWHRAWGPEIDIRRRSDKEMAAILLCWGGGARRHPLPPGWDFSQPSLAVFGLSSFPIHSSQRESLAALEDALSPGSLRDIVHVTRLTQAVYDAKEGVPSRSAMSALFRWIDARPEIERHWIALRLAEQWYPANRGRAAFMYEFLDELVPRLPQSYGIGDYRERFRKQCLSEDPGYAEHSKQRARRP